MHLERAVYEVRELRWAERTALAHHVLSINKKAVLALAEDDPFLRQVDAEIVHPGDPVRITHALDAIEPMVKVDGPSCAFPGLLGPACTAGSGRTHCLRGMAVIQVAHFPEPQSGVLSFTEGMLDMGGPGAPYCVCANTVNLLLLIEPAAEASNAEFDSSLRRFGLRVATYLAEASRDVAPDSVEVFTSGLTDPALPKVAYIDQVQHQGLLVQTLLYGKHLGDLVPTLLHPNEMLDGAVVSGNYKNPIKVPTILHCNNPVVLELCRRHGKDLNFLGVILTRGHHDNHTLKERSAQYAAKLASLIGADGVILTMEGSGNTTVDFMQTVKACEQRGVKTVACLHEFGGADGRDAPLVDSVLEADAIVSTGGVDRVFHVPAPGRVIGGQMIDAALEQVVGGQGIDAAQARTCSGFHFYGACWQMGVSRMQAVAY